MDKLTDETLGRETSDDEVVERGASTDPGATAWTAGEPAPAPVELSEPVSAPVELSEPVSAPVELSEPVPAPSGLSEPVPPPAGLSELVPAPFQVGREDHELGAVILTLRGELDLAAVPELQEDLHGAMRGAAAIVVDLSDLQFVDSSGLNVLVQAERKLRAAGRQLVLVAGPPPVRRVLEITGFDRYFEVCDSVSAAMRAALEREIASNVSPCPVPNREIAAEPDRRQRGVMWR